MKAYLDILDNCLKNGTLSDNRTGIKTIRIPWGATFEHNMEMGFPLITTKKMGLKNISTELEMFIKGITDKKWLTDRNCHIWDEWASIKKWEPIYNNIFNNIADANEQTQNLNITPEFEKSLKNAIINATRDLGPIYGWQWRHFGSDYHFNSNDVSDNYNPLNAGVDQLKNVIETAKKDPNNRRLIVGAWNPVDLYEMALPPCHLSLLFQ